MRATLDRCAREDELIQFCAFTVLYCTLKRIWNNEKSAAFELVVVGVQVPERDNRELVGIFSRQIRRMYPSILLDIGVV